MSAINARIGTHIELYAAQLQPAEMRMLTEALMIPNPGKERAVSEMVWGASRMPDFVSLYEFDDGILRLPRGFIHNLTAGMAKLGHEIVWDDQRVSYPIRVWPDMDQISLRDYQERACQAILEHENGVYQAPTGSGKTRVVLEAIRRAQQPALVIVDKVALAQQWIKNCVEQLGFAPGMIGEGVWRPKAITIALRQSLWSRALAAPDDHFWQSFGFLCVDEEHHVASAETLTELVQLFPARWRIGVTATPSRDDETFPIAQAVVGPVIHETTYEDASDHLVKPFVRVLRSNFNFDYRPTRKVEDPETKKKRVIRNNYTAMMAALSENDARNTVIATTAETEALDGHCCLIVSRRKRQLEEIRRMLSSVPIFSLTGDQTGAEAQEIAEIIERSVAGCVLLSTVADEALDMPRLDRLFLAYPVRKTSVVQQQVGRIARPHEGKKDAVIYDVRDPQELLASQHRDRLFFYKQQGWEIEQYDRVVA